MRFALREINQNSFKPLSRLLGATALLSLLTGAVSAQVLYDTLTSGVAQTGDNRPAVLIYGFPDTGSPNPAYSAVLGSKVVTHLMADDLIINPSSPSTLNSIQFTVWNTNTSAITVNGHLGIWDDNGITPEAIYPAGTPYPDISANPGYQPSNDAPGTKLGFFDISNITIPAATQAPSGAIIASSTLVTVNVPFGSLETPFTQGRYWFGLVFEQDRDAVSFPNAEDQLRRVGRVGLGLYNTPTVGQSGDVNFETGDTTTFGGLPSNQPNPYLGAGGAKANYYNQNNPNLEGYYNTFPGGFQNNFGWLLNGSSVVPEPGAIGFVLFGLPLLAVARRRSR